MTIANVPREKIRKAMRDITHTHGPFTFVAVMRRKDALGDWDLVVSAPWLEAGKLRALSELVQLLEASAGQGFVAQFARVATISNDNPTVRRLLAEKPVDESLGVRQLQNVELFGLDIDEAIIFRAMKPQGKKPRQRPSASVS